MPIFPMRFQISTKYLGKNFQHDRFTGEKISRRMSICLGWHSCWVMPFAQAQSLAGIMCLARAIVSTTEADGQSQRSELATTIFWPGISLVNYPPSIIRLYTHLGIL